MFFIFIISFGASADTCLVTDEMMEELKSKYFDKIVIATTQEDSKYLVTIKLPSQIENQSEYTVFLASDSAENPSFITPLEVFYDKEEISTWYQIDEDKITKQFLIVGLKNTCGPSIIKEVVYK